jgi:hypothetical protein
MSDFLSSAKNFVNSAMSRTGWEAQKQLRVRNKQSEIDKLVEQRQHLMDELGQIAMNLYQQGGLTDTQLSRICASIFELDHDLRTREAQAQEIKDEAYPADQFTPGPTMNYAPPASSTGTPPPPPPNSGPQPVNSFNAQQPAGPAPTPGPGPSNAQQQLCPHCGSVLRSNSLYCRGCGSKVR